MFRSGGKVKVSDFTAGSMQECVLQYAKETDKYVCSYVLEDGRMS